MQKNVVVWFGSRMNLRPILGAFLDEKFLSNLSGHQGILNLYPVNLPRGYQRQSKQEEASPCCADEAKIHMEFNNLNAGTVLQAAVKTICVYGT